MSSGSHGDSRFCGGWSQADRPAGKVSRVSQLRKLQECEQVAAVCYRVRREAVEFLLVETRGGRWTFPKGGAEPGLTHAQAAALEAFEEAGVHGRMEHAPFARYVRRKRGGRRSAAGSAGKSDGKQRVVLAHLCEVLRLSPPQESRRNPTWFSAEKAKRRLREDRSSEDGAELARVVEEAATRIHWLRHGAVAAGDVLEKSGVPPARSEKDALQKVQFEAGDGAHVRGRMDVAAGASFVQYVRRPRGDLGDPAAIELAVQTYLCKVLRLSSPRGWNRDAMRLPPEQAKLGLPEACAPDPSQPAEMVEIDNAVGAAGRAKTVNQRPRNGGRLTTDDCS
jgi:8-oxo-dGTP pyrophosphatase MutT (NUDIX family)